jgi:beta-galactosidase
VIACIPGWQHYLENETFKNNSYRNVRDLVRRDRNYASVILYETILNESRYTAEYAQETYRICKEEDPFSFAACDYGRPGAEIYDVNYKVPDDSKPFYTREWGDDNRYTGRHGMIWGDWGCRADEHAMVYQSLARQKDLNGDGYWDWHGVNKKPTTAGYALWVGMDHNRGNNDNIARCGVWGLDRYPKFCLYFLKAQRDPNLKLDGFDSGPMIFIGSFWRESSLKDVSVYSNCDKVNLYLNDELIATQTPDTTYDEGKGPQPINYVPHPIFTFKNLTWVPGTLRAEGLIDGKVVAVHEVTTPGPPAQLVVEMDTEGRALVADGSEMAMLFIKALDKDGNLVPDFAGEITVDIGGEGRLIGANPVRAEGGVAAIWLRSTTRAGEISVTASNETLGAMTFSTATRPSADRFVAGPDVGEPRQIRRVEAGVEAKEVFDGVRVDGLKLKVSSTQAGSAADRLLDGNRESWWFAASSQNEWIELILPEPMVLRGSLVVWEKDSTAYNFIVEVSDNGEDWHQVYQGSETGHDFSPEIWEVKMKAGYVRIRVTEVSPSDSLLGIREIELYR